jgi:hypothetical protein
MLSPSLIVAWELRALKRRLPEKLLAKSNHKITLK